MITALALGYIYNLGRAFDQLLNAALGGNSRQTFSSRIYEAAIISRLWYWRPLYYAVNAAAFAIRYIALRPLGYRPARDWPANHCMDAWFAHPEDRTYPQ